MVCYRFERFKKPLLILVPIFLGFFICWSPDFFDIHAFKNYGDIVFPFRPITHLMSTYFSWNDNSGVGLGNPNMQLMQIPLSLFFVFLSKLGIPSWLANRMYIMMPLIIMGWSVYYLFTSVAKGKYTKISGILSALFVLFVPIFDADPLVYLSLAFFPFILGSLIRCLDSRPCSMITYAFIPFGIMFLSLSPRYLYMACLVAISYILFNFFTYRKTPINYRIKFLVLSSVLIILFNFFWIFPFIRNLFSEAPYANLFSYDKSFIERLGVMKTYVGVSSPAWTFRLLLNRSGVAASRFSLILFIIPIYSYLSVFFIKNRKILFLICISFLFQFFEFSAHYPLTLRVYSLLQEHVFGFWILNSPQYWISFLGIFYGILTGITTQGILKWLDSSTWHQPAKLLSKFSVLVVIFSLSFYVYGDAFSQFPWGIERVKNFLKIPSDYDKLEQYLALNSQPGDRLLNLPWVTLGYARYTWWLGHPVPAIVGTKSPIPVTGIGSHPVKELRELWGYSYNDFLLHNILNEDSDRTIREIASMGFKFILCHRDYIGVPLGFAPTLGVYESAFLKTPYYETVMDNSHFVLLKGRLNVNPLFEIEPSLQTKGSPKISGFQKINPTKYIVEITNIDGPFYLLFKQPYNTSWKAYILRENSRNRHSASFLERWSLLFDSYQQDNNSVELKIHKRFNKYFNKYRVDANNIFPESKTPNSFSIVVEFDKQRSYTIGYIISLASIFFFLATFLFLKYLRPSKGKP